MEADPFLQSFDSSELQIAKEFLTNWLPFLTKDLCEGCNVALCDRIQELKSVNERTLGDPEEEKVRPGMERLELTSVKEASDVACGFDGYFRASPEGWEHIKATGWDTDPEPVSPKVRMSWDDMVRQDQQEEGQEVDARWNSLEDGMEGGKEEVGVKKSGLSKEQGELTRFKSMGRKKDFVCLERIDGRIVNILEGLELHTGVFSAVEQKKIVDLVYELQEKERNNELGEHTYSEESKPRKYMRRKGHATIQFGCCYNYMEHNKIPSGSIHGMVADPIPNFIKAMIKRLIGWHVIPPACVPDSCRVNIYEPGDFAPLNIESHDFVRPFCTVSFLNECNINFGSNLKEDDTGEFIGSIAIPVPVGSVLVLNGKGADVAMHAVSAAPSKRISITLWKMEKNMWPLGFIREPDLQNIRPYFDSGTDSRSKTNEMEPFAEIKTTGSGRKFNGRSDGARRVWQNSKKVGGSVFDRLTPTKKSFHPSTEANSSTNHTSIERARDSRDFLHDHCAVPDETEELPGGSQHGWMKDVKHPDHNEASSERNVRIDQKRIIITRNLSREDDSFAGMTSQAHPHVRIRTFKNNQRRARMIQ